MNGFEKQLTALVERVAPADLRIRVVKASAELRAVLPDSMNGEQHYTVSFQTRSFDEGGHGGTVREAVELTLDSLEEGPKDIDPVVPSWYALSRMQREVVEQALKGLAAEHKARAAVKNLTHERDAHTEYEISDAFEAALACLEFEYENGPGAAWEPLQARNGPAVHKPTDPTDPPEELSPAAQTARRKKLSVTVKDLRTKNRKRAAAPKRKKA
ncbi:MAG TPA: hypothetical protein VK524_27050 [Polyangiaceae bacterium]|nr:hypothetical protein [Polyangiaceae bacterium]